MIPIYFMFHAIDPPVAHWLVAMKKRN